MYWVLQPAKSQLCLCHGLHLAVVETFYKKKIFESDDVDIIEDEDDDDFQDNDFLVDFNEEELADDEDDDIQNNLKNVRNLIKFFKKSSVRNSILQKQIIDEIEQQRCRQRRVRDRR